jgi:hypothetical protein
LRYRDHLQEPLRLALAKAFNLQSEDAEDVTKDRKNESLHGHDLFDPLATLLSLKMFVGLPTPKASQVLDCEYF